MILGRKDVGGITGQLVPEVRLLYTESQVGDLLDELDVLRDLIGRTNDDARSASNEISERMQAISDRAGRSRGLSVTWQISPQTGPMKTLMRSTACLPGSPGSRINCLPLWRMPQTRWI